MGEPGSKAWIEGFGLTPAGIELDDIEYQAVLGRGWLSPWVEGGKFCGSRGMALPLLGIRIRLKGAAADAFDCRYAATFVDAASPDRSRWANPANRNRLRRWNRSGSSWRRNPRLGRAKPPPSPRRAPVGADHRHRAGRARPARAPERLRTVNFLFVHHNFPGQFLHIVKHLAESRRH
jgi:hypothetical protein